MSLHHADSAWMMSAFAANLMRPSIDGSGGPMGGGVNNVEFHIQNEDFPALPGANHMEHNNHAPTSSMVCGWAGKWAREGIISQSHKHSLML